jgi:hypothetical protein
VSSVQLRISRSVEGKIFRLRSSAASGIAYTFVRGAFLGSTQRVENPNVLVEVEFAKSDSSFPS